MSDPRILGKYRLIAELARGGMGVVYLAVTSGLGGFSKLVVVKELKPELVEDAGFLEMFLEEARLAAHLNHPNVVPTYEVDIDGKRPFIVMEYLDGQTLARILRKKIEGFTLNMQLRVLTHALDGLQYAHRREQFDGTTLSVVHRDVSPQNVFVTYDGQVKVVDFGIAKGSDTTVETRTGVFKGKPSYMAPEQLHGEVDPLADVFAVGVIIWEALAGRRMWKRRNDVEVLTLLLKGEIPSIDEAAPDAPEELRRIVKKGVAGDRAVRYQTARELREDLDAYLESVGDRLTLKEIGLVVAGAFEDQRERLRTIIERCIAESKEVSAQAPRAKLPSLATVDETSSMSTSMPPVGLRGHEGYTMKMEAPLPVSTSMLTSGSISGATPQGSTVDAPTPPMQEERKPLGPIPFIAAGSLGVVGIIIILLVLTMSRKPRVEQATSVVEVPSDTAEPAVTVSVTTAPPAATTAPPSASGSAPTPAATGSATATTAAANATVATPTPTSTPAPKSAPPPQVRPTWTHVALPKPAPPRPSATPTPAPIPTPIPASPPKTDCNPPFYFEGTKKLFKPGCL